MDQAALFIKIFINYTQIISAILTFNLSIPKVNLKIINNNLTFLWYFSEAGVIVESAGNPIKRALYSMDCYLIGLSTKE
jgi:hypothetical protein